MSFALVEKIQNYVVLPVNHRIQKAREVEADKQRKNEFLAEISRARRELQAARANYNFAQESALLDYYIYEIKAAETRLNYYIKLAKREKLTNEDFLYQATHSPIRRGEEQI